MNNLYVTVESYPEQNISDCCKDAIALSERIGIDIHLNFNGVRCIVRSGDNLVEVVDAFNYLINTGTKQSSMQRAEDEYGTNE